MDWNMPGQRQAAGKAEWGREVLPALLPEEQKGRGKSLILSILHIPGTVLGMRKPKGRQEEKVSLLLH